MRRGLRPPQAPARYQVLHETPDDGSRGLAPGWTRPYRVVSRYAKDFCP
jgi:hypothetical protein